MNPHLDSSHRDTSDQARQLSCKLATMSKCPSTPGIKSAITILQTTFAKYAGAEGDPNTLSKKEVVTMLKAELPEIDALINQQDPKDPKQKQKQDQANEFFQMLDEDGDGSVCFNEFIVFCATLALLCQKG
uniref:EF-hand domain-containing protein n=1 Tax=Iconisemion striatum TaxID=60296 RepID=A0A1A7WUP9_9TELE